MDAVIQVAERLPVHRELRPVAMAALGFAAVAAMAAAAAIAIAGAPADPGRIALARALIVGVPLAVGLYAWYRGTDARFGLVLMAAGAGTFVTTLAESQDELTYTIGRAAGWIAGVLLVYVVLAFPSGRLGARIDRMLVGAMGGVLLTLFIPQLIVAEDFSVPSPYTSCIRDCPSNAFLLLEREPAFVDAAMRPLGAVLVLAVMIVVVLRMARRMSDAAPLMRSILAPVVAIAGACAGALGIVIVAGEADPGVAAVWLLALTLPAIALAFVAGLLRWRLFGERALRRLAACLGSLPNAVTLRRAFADAFGDPAIEIVFPAGGPDAAWMDCRGRPVTLPAPDSGRSVSSVSHAGTLVAAIVHDAELRARPELVQAGVAMAGVVLDNQRLAAETEASIRELRGSRARIAATAERERRRIERDLHDGAQQRLVALRIELELAGDLVRRDPERGALRLHELEQHVDDALDELRALAHGVYPPLLADRGLTEALAGVAARSTIAVELEARDVGRHPPEVESAVYFCVLEALQNVHKHARSAHRVVVHVERGANAGMRFSVRDDGPGTAALRTGAGITNMQDRLAAVGGDVVVSSTPGVGTVVRGRVP